MIDLQGQPRRGAWSPPPRVLDSQDVVRRLRVVADERGHTGQPDPWWRRAWCVVALVLFGAASIGWAVSEWVAKLARREP